MNPQTKKVLILESDPADAKRLSQRLAADNNFSFQVQCLPTLAQGLAHLDRERPDVILLDLMLRDSNGIETFNQLHSRFPEIPIVIASHSDNAQIALEAIRKGAQDYLIKRKIDGDMLPSILQYAIERQDIQKKLAATKNELELANTRLAMLVLLDPLTEFYNRRGLQRILTREIRAGRRGSTDPIVLLIDLDDFKRINDSLGHAVGDVVLKEIAGKIKSALRATDYVARIGGDEFLILMPQTRLAEGRMIAERVRLAISGTAVALSSGPVNVTASIGMVLASENTPSIDELVAKSHLALLKSKQGGKNRVSFADSKKTDPGDLCSEILGLFQPEKNSFYTVIQPIFNLLEGKEIGYEFLSRSTIKGFEIPEYFFRFCLENNILTLVDHQCLKTCLAAACSLPPSLRRHLNIFPSTLIEIPVEDLLANLPEKREKGTFCLEISEQQIIGDPSYLMPAVRVLKKAGILIAIDDVGFGRSCLESLILLEPDIVKIDKKFIDGIGQDEWRRELLKRLLNGAASLNAEIVAEGIESPRDLAALKELGVLYGQGFLLGKPVELSVVLGSRRR